MIFFILLVEKWQGIGGVLFGIACILFWSRSLNDGPTEYELRYLEEQRQKESPPTRMGEGASGKNQETL